MKRRNVILVLFFNTLASAAVLPQYTIEKLDGNSWTALNNNGVVAGSWGGHAAVWQSGKGVTDLGTLGGAYSSANGINDFGQVVGTSETSTGETHAFIWDAKNGMRDLGRMGGTYPRPEAINNSGQIGGNVSPIQGHRIGYLWEDNQIAALFGGEVRCTNDQGHVVFAVEIFDQPGIQNFSYQYWDGDDRTTNLPLWGDAGPDSQGDAQAMNNLGQVVGFRESLIHFEPPDYFEQIVRRAYVWDEESGFTYLDGFGQVPTQMIHPTRAMGINDAGIVVGQKTVDYIGEAFIWESETGMITLMDLLADTTGWEGLDYAFEINEQGQILGYSRGSSFLMTPVPEPAGIVLLGFGGLALLRKRGRA